VQKWVMVPRDNGISSAPLPPGRLPTSIPAQPLGSEYGGAGNLPTVTGTQAGGTAMNRYVLSSTVPVGAGSAATVAADTPSSGGGAGERQRCPYRRPLWPVTY
jgi:hypothetical protein